MEFRTATESDLPGIAHLHAESWRAAYRGMMSDRFLEHDVVDNRLALWRKRLSTPGDSPYVLVADVGGTICGFICIFAGADPAYGALLDNLHILPHWQGKGIGLALLRRAAHWLETTDPGMGMYLWVFTANHGARRFYARHGGRELDRRTEAGWGEQPVELVRCVWDRVAPLAEGISSV